MQRRIEIHTRTDFSEEDVIRAMGRLVTDDPEEALPGPVFALELDEHDRVRIDHMRPERSSLELMGAQRLAVAVNRLDRLTLGRVLWLAHKGREGGSESAWEAMRHAVPDAKLKESLDRAGDEGTLGTLRMALVHDYMGTWNGNGDRWVLWAAERFGEPPTPDHEQLPLTY